MAGEGGGGAAVKGARQKQKKTPYIRMMCSIWLHKPDVQKHTETEMCDMRHSRLRAREMYRQIE